MSDEERGGGVGGFLFGVVVGAALGLLFAPAAGGATRRRLASRLEDLRERAAGEVKELRALVSGDDADDAPRSDREELRQRLTDARQRRRSPGAARRAGAAELEEDDPVA